MIALLAAGIAVLGTLLGAIVTGHIQDRAATRTAGENRRDDHRREQIAAITALATAVSTHRSTMWNRGDAKFREQAERHQELRIRSRETRAAVAGPLMTFRLLVTDPAVRTAADRMVDTTFGMRHQDTDPDTLNTAWAAAVAAHDDFVNTASRHLQTLSAA